MFRKLLQLRWFVLMTGMVMGMFIVGCAGTVSEGPSVQPGRFSPSQPVAMTCSEATYHSYSGSLAGNTTGRHVCRELKGSDGKAVREINGPDGKAVAVRLLDTRQGTKVSCIDQEGKLTCPNEPIAALARTSPWGLGNPGFVFPPIGVGGQ